MTLSHWSFSSQSRLGFFPINSCSFFCALHSDDSSWQVSDEKLWRYEHFNHDKNNCFYWSSVICINHRPHSNSTWILSCWFWKTLSCFFRSWKGGKPIIYFRWNDLFGTKFPEVLFVWCSDSNSAIISTKKFMWMVWLPTSKYVNFFKFLRISIPITYYSRHSFHVFKAFDQKPVDHVAISIAALVFKKPLCKFLEAIEVFIVIIKNFVWVSASSPTKYLNLVQHSEDICVPLLTLNRRMHGITFHVRVTTL